MFIAMSSRLRLLFVFMLSLWCVVSAQQSDSLAILEQFPACAQRCLLTTFVQGTCAPTDMDCICKNQQFQSTVTDCVTQSCTIREALVTKNTSSTNCGLPVRDRGANYYSLSYVIIVLSWLFVIARFAFKIFERHEVELDDWTILATTILGTALTAVTIGGTIKHGLGRDLWTVEPNEITKMLLYFEIVAVLYFTTLTLLKLSIIFFYIKVFTTMEAQRLLWSTAAFTAVWGTMYVLLAIFQCQPISYFWTHWDGTHQGSCLNINAITSSNAGFSIALDFWSLGIPLWQLRGLQMNWKKKVGVALMFVVGTFVTVVSILRLQALVNFAKSQNVSWEFYDVSIWSTIELGVGVMCTCLPTVRLLLIKFFPIIGGSSNRSGQNRRKYGSDNRLNELDNPRIRNPHRLGLSDPFSRGSKSFPDENSIVVKTTYAVNRTESDADEISLVEKNISGSSMSSKDIGEVHRI